MFNHVTLRFFRNQFCLPYKMQLAVIAFMRIIHKRMFCIHKKTTHSHGNQAIFLTNQPWSIFFPIQANGCLRGVAPLLWTALSATAKRKTIRRNMNQCGSWCTSRNMCWHGDEKMFQTFQAILRIAQICVVIAIASGTMQLFYASNGT